MSAYPAQPPPLPTPQPAAAPAPVAGRALPPPLPRPVLPYYDRYAPHPRAPGNWLAITVCSLSAVFLVGTFALNNARANLSGATVNDMLLACGVFPLSLILGFFLFCISVGAAICTPGRARILAILAVALTAAAFMLAFSQT